MNAFLNLFGHLISFFYYCFDRIVIRGYLYPLSHCSTLVSFFKDILGKKIISKEVLSERTGEYQKWVESYARNQSIPIEWAQKGVRKEDYVKPYLERLIKKGQEKGVYFIFKSMEQETTFRSAKPKYETSDPNYRIITKKRSLFTHYYFYILDPVLGPLIMRMASFLPFHATYYLNGHSDIRL